MYVKNIRSSAKPDESVPLAPKRAGQIFTSSSYEKDEFLNQPHLTKIVKIRAFFVLLKKKVEKIEIDNIDF